MTKKELQERYDLLEKNFEETEEDWATAARGLRKEKLKTLVISKVLECENVDYLYDLGVVLGSMTNTRLKMDNKGDYIYVREEMA